jgi:hypothetical protein
VGLAVFAEVAAVGVDHRGGVVVDAGHRLFVDRDDDHHLVLLRELLHQFDGRAVGDALGRGVPFGILAGTEIGLGKNLLEAQDLHALTARLLDQRDVGVEHRLPDFFRGFLGRRLQRHLDQAAAHLGHGKSSRRIWLSF